MTPFHQKFAPVKKTQNEMCLPVKSSYEIQSTKMDTKIKCVFASKF